MATFYQILGLPKSATAAEIKSAFKSLALQYHPDLNPDNPEAEEKFKEINRAYQVLSDSYKKYQYDLSFDVRRHPATPPRSTYEPFNYPPFRNRPKYPTGGYQYGWKYVKAQVVAFAFIFIVAAMVMGVKLLYDEYKIAKEERLAAAREILFQEAQTYFDNGDYRKSLDILKEMYYRNPIEGTISDHREKMLRQVMNEANNQFMLNNYESAIVSFGIVKDYQVIENPLVYRRLAESYKAMEMYLDAVAALELLQKDDPTNLKLNMEIGLIYFDDLRLPENAKPYLDNSRNRVKEILTDIYGRAAELVMMPDESPQIYFDVFYAHARLYTELGMSEGAIKDTNWSIFLRPNQSHPYYLRGTNYLAVGNNVRACKNLYEASKRGDKKAGEMLLKYCR